MSDRRPEPVPAVLTALNLNGLGVARALGRRGVPVFAVHDGRPGPELRCRYLRGVWIREPGEDLIDLLLRRAPELGPRPAVLHAITDETVSALAGAAERLRAAYRLPFGDPATVLRLSSKKGIDEVAREHGLAVPPTFVVDAPADIERVAAAVRYPCILKPQDKTPGFAASGASKAQRLDSADALTAAYRAFCEREPRAVVQEFIPGGDGDVWFCLVAIAQSGELLDAFVGRKLRQWPPLCGGTASCAPADAPELVECSARFFRATGLRGVGSIEFKRDPRDGRFYLIEPTVGRTDWQSALADLNGVPLPWLVHCDVSGLPVPRLRRAWLRWRWVHWSAERNAVAWYRARGEFRLGAWLWSLRPPLRWAWFSWRDPGPALAIVRDTFARARRKLGRKFGSAAPTDASDHG